MKRWKIIICQHPMPMLIQKGEKEILEREPPWGENSMPDYLERIHKNLDYVEKNPNFKINYDLSALELEMIEQYRPDLIRQLKENLKAGHIGFVGGTYTQSHLQVFDPESNYLQFEFGLEVFNRLLGQKFLTYAVQETGIHEQLPQLLKSLGYHYTTVPAFYWAIEFPHWDSPMTLIGNWLDKAFMYDTSTCLWKGLDGTFMPLFLEVTDRWSDDFFFRKEQKGLFGESELYVFFPDLLEIDDEFGSIVAQRGDTDLLDSALRAYFDQYPPKSIARLFTYWSYAEGTEAEATLRENNLAVCAIQQAEAIAVLSRALGWTDQPSFREHWRRILATQHHDVHWCETKLLKEESKRDLKVCANEAIKTIYSYGEKILNRIELDDEALYKLIIFNTLPYPRTDHVEFEISFNEGEVRNFIVIDEGEKRVTFQVIEESLYPDGSIEKCKCIVVTSLSGLGYKIYSLRPQTEKTQQKSEHLLAASHGFTFTNPYYRTEINSLGEFLSIRLPGGSNSLLGPQGAGFFLAAGERLENELDASARLISDGPVCSIIKEQSRIHQAEITTRAVFYASLPRIDFTHVMQFDRSVIGNLWEDEDKLNWIWSFSFEGKVTHDIPFGIRTEAIGRPVLCPSWIDYSDEAQGIAIAQYSHPKFWSKERWLANVIAWGGRRVSNRMHRFWVENAEFDILLNGTFLASHAVFPHLGNWKDAHIPRLARSYREPLIAVAMKNGKRPLENQLPKEYCLVSIREDNIVPTATRISPDNQDSFMIRFFETFGVGTYLGETIKGNLGLVETFDLNGDVLDELDPFQIGQIRGTLSQGPGKTIG